MSFEGPNIIHLEDSDFMGNTLRHSFGGKPVIIVLEASYCGYCKQFQPTFQQFANSSSGRVVCCAIQGDSKIPSVQALSKKIKEIFPNFQGYPSVYKMINGQIVDIYNGDRTLPSLSQWAGVN